MTPPDDAAKAKPKRPRKARMSAGQKKKNKERRLQLAQEASAELESLRSTLHDILEQFQIRVSGQLAELAAVLDAGVGGSEPVAPPLAVLESVLEKIRKTEVKPRKGRVKDLARLQSLAEELTELLGANPLD